MNVKEDRIIIKDILFKNLELIKLAGNKEMICQELADAILLDFIEKDETEELRKEITELRSRFNACWLCGKIPTKHHLNPKNKAKEKGTIPLCRECHNYIEEVKKIIELMKKEKRLSVTRFKQLLKTMELI
jgi:hypothetical protein